MLRRFKNMKMVPYILALVLLGIAGGYLYSLHRYRISAVDSNFRGGETGKVLSASLFSGQVADVYMMAEKIPEVLDRLYCYCRCRENMGHKSLLTCFTGRHASNCDICLEEAATAYSMTNDGKNVIEIRKVFDRKFSEL